ncbi:MAG: 50S ribosomal protein L16 [Candidatus Woesearchaeota archaeon]
MAKLRKANAYRNVKRAYTRKSKYRNQSYVKATAHNRIVKFEHGNLSGTFTYCVLLKSKSDIQIRHNALEAARKASNRILETTLGKDDYRLKVRVYPHHILRENPLASGAGADRMSTGMARSFGKAIGLAAQIKKGQPVFEVDVEEKHLSVAKEALRSIKSKLPCPCIVSVQKNKPKAE